MGTGIVVNCPNCDYSDRFMLGAGMMYPAVYQATVKDVKSGKYGAEWKSLLEENRGAVIHAGKELYRCPKCRALETRPNLSVYTSSSETPTEGYWPYWIRDGYTLVKRYEHKCPACSETMIQVQVDDDEECEQSVLPCPKCGAKLRIAGGICWD